jgi:CRP/FNR family transcriptional regulator, cyclic AMP receptor protein
MQQSLTLGDRVRFGMRRGPLRDLPSPSIERMVAAGIVQQLTDGQIQPPWQTGPTVVVDGLVRLRTRTPEGREWTIRYVECGGTVHFAPISSANSGLHLQALIDSILLVVDREVLRRWMSADAGVASTVAAAIANELAGTIAEVTNTALRPLHTRLCNHLLYLAERWPDRDGRLPLTHHDLACAVGSVRDVVTRILDELQSAGAIELRRGVIVMRDLPRLRAFRDAWDPLVTQSRPRSLTVT